MRKHIKLIVTVILIVIAITSFLFSLQIISQEAETKGIISSDFATIEYNNLSFINTYYIPDDAVLIDKFYAKLDGENLASQVLWPQVCKLYKSKDGRLWMELISETDRENKHMPYYINL